MDKIVKREKIDGTLNGKEEEKKRLVIKAIYPAMRFFFLSE